MRVLWAKLQKKYKLLAAAFLMVGVGSLATLGVMAAIPNTNGVISGCYRTNGGSLRVIDSPTQTCSSNEAAISWNEATPGQFVKNLVGADFSDTSLQYRNFYGVDLHGAVFNNANLSGSDLRNANLSQTSFEGAEVKIKGTNFSGSNLTSAIFKDIYSPGGNFNGATLASTTFDSAAFTQANFSNVDFRTAIIVNNGIQLYENSNLSNANFSGHNFPNMIAVYSSNLTNANFSNSSFGNLQIGAGSNVTGVDFSNSQFTNSYFAGTNLSVANLTNVTWSNVICPDVTNSNDNGNTCIGHLVP